MVRMAARYGHLTLNELRDAVDSISSTNSEGVSLVFSPVSEQAPKSGRANWLKEIWLLR